MPMNKAIIQGRLGQDPELKYLPDGNACANMSVATSESWKDKSGQKQEKTEWHRIVTFGKVAENCSKYLKKGSLVLLEGKIQTRSWENQQGGKNYITEIISNNVQFISTNTNANNNPQGELTPQPAPTNNHSQPEQRNQQRNYSSAPLNNNYNSDSIPF
jgi:single-strand DNA-binding protein